MMLDAALAYCRAGLPVFPLEPGGKAPIRGLPGGFHAASVEESIARARWTQWPSANLGVAVPDVYVVIDVDPRNGGDLTIEALEAQYGPLPPTLTAATGSGGRHYWFRKPASLKLRKQLGKGVETISETGYAAVPPSTTARPYHWLDVEQFDPHEIAELPDWLAKFAAVPAAEDTAPNAKSAQGYIDGRQIEEITSALAHLPADDYQTWVNCGMALHSIGAPEALDMWLQWSQRSPKYEHKAALDKWRSFGRGGKGGLTVKSIFQWAQEAGWQNPLKGSAPMANVVQFPVAQPAIDFGDAVADAAGFIADWQAPEYLIDGIIQRGFLYALTGHSNAGKTACLTLMEVCIALGVKFANRDTERGKVVVLCGENPDDYRNRLIATCQAMFISPEALAGNLIVIPRAFQVTEGINWLRERLAQIGEASLIVVDTFAAYFAGDDENSNVQARHNAQLWRSLTYGPGKPAVILACHPTKSAERGNLLPRGGSAINGELDANLTVWKDAESIQLSHLKIRGQAFEPIEFKLTGRTLDGYKDTRGRAVNSVVAEPLCDATAQQINREARSDENALLAAMFDDKNGSAADWARTCGWSYGDGSPNKSKVQRLLHRLKEDKLVRLYRKDWVLTKAGRDEHDKAVAERLMRR